MTGLVGVMTVFSLARLRRRLLVAAMLSLLTIGASAHGLPAPAVLLAHYHQIRPQLVHNPFGVPIYVRSREQGDLLAAEVYGQLHVPLAQVQAALARPAGWCDLLALTLNVKACVHDGVDGRRALTLYVGRKFYQPPDDAYRMRYRFRVGAEAPAYFEASLTAADGPLGTSDYRIVLQAVPVPGGTLIHIRSAYRTSLTSRWATSAYLATLGRGKVGFSRVRQDAQGQPVYVEGVRGIVERNTMRYYLALRAVLATRKLPAGERFEGRIHRWFDLTERYQRQLHEIDRTDYLQAKRREHVNQMRLQSALSSLASGR